jgi:hypothetical protein
MANVRRSVRQPHDRHARRVGNPHGQPELVVHRPQVFRLLDQHEKELGATGKGVNPQSRPPAPVRILGAHGRSVEPDGLLGEGHPLPADEPALCAYYVAAAQGVSVLGERAGKPTLRLVVPQSPTAQNAMDDDEAVAEVGEVNVHAT